MKNTNKALLISIFLFSCSNSKAMNYLQEVYYLINPSARIEQDPKKQVELSRELSDAIHAENVDAVKAALAAGANPNYQFESIRLNNTRPGNDSTHLMRHVYRNTVRNPEEFEQHKRVLQTLINYGANVNLQDQSNRWTALHHAVYKRNFAGLQTLLDNGADKTLKGRNQTPEEFALHLAAQNNDNEYLLIAEILGNRKTFDDYIRFLQNETINLPELPALPEPEEQQEEFFFDDDDEGIEDL